MHRNGILAWSLLGVVLSAQSQGTPPAERRGIPPARAPLQEMVTDRPDFTESTGVVGKGVVQFENGFTAERNDAGSNLAGPELLLRVGLSKRVELRFGGDGFLSQRLPDARAFGFSDVELGAKIRLFGERRRTPAVSLIPILSLPVGSRYFSSGGYDPTLKVALGKDLVRGFSLGGNVNFSSLNTLDGRFFQTAWSASLAHDLGRGFGGYWELFGFAPWEKDGSPAWIANTGITRSVTSNVQFDGRAGRRLSDSGPDWFWGVGIAIRQPWALVRPVRR